MLFKATSTGLKFPFLNQRQVSDELQNAMDSFRSALLGLEGGITLSLVSGELFYTIDGAGGLDAGAVGRHVRKILQDVWPGHGSIVVRTDNFSCANLQPHLDQRFEKTGADAILAWHRWSLWAQIPHTVKKITGASISLENKCYKLSFRCHLEGHNELLIQSKNDENNLHGLCQQIHLKLLRTDQLQDKFKSCLPENATSILGLDFQFVAGGLTIVPSLEKDWRAHPKSVTSCIVEWVEKEPTRL